MTYKEWQKTLRLRCRPSEGQELSGDDQQFLHEMQEKYPKEYAALDRRVFLHLNKNGRF